MQELLNELQEIAYRAKALQMIVDAQATSDEDETVSSFLIGAEEHLFEAVGHLNMAIKHITTKKATP